MERMVEMIKKLIAQYNDRNSVYGDELTNHLNMGLYALYQMGADENDLHTYAQKYLDSKNVAPQPPISVTVTEDNFENYLGRIGYYSSFIPFYTKQVEHLGIDKTLKKYLNRLIDGSAGGAFHGLIRTAYAYELASEEEVAKALAYFSECYQAYPLERAPEEITEPFEHIQNLSTMEHFKNFVFKRPLITGRMIDIYKDGVFRQEVRALPQQMCNSAAFSDMLLILYGKTGDFTMLHGFTSTHALRVLKKFVDDYTNVLKMHWIHLQLAYLSTGCVPLNPLPEAEYIEEWETIFEAALKVEDVHTIKLVYSLHEQSDVGEEADQLYRQIAQYRINQST